MYGTETEPRKEESNGNHHHSPEKPWKIIYKVEKDIVHILAVIDSRRDLQEILIEKLITP